LPDRSTRTGRSEYDRPETIEETAELVTRLRGAGTAVAVDHLEADQVEGLAEQIRKEHGHIDVLVNDIGALSCSREVLLIGRYGNTILLS
jgi:NAD(P)-dependent dehydrogenase (short-subunit alcohol dehydrogenase family)